MNERALNVYYRKKYLKRSFMLCSFSLSVWVSIYFIFIFQIILKRHPNVGDTTHIITSIILTVIFAAWAAKLVRILIVCITEYRSAPNIAYSLTEDGIRGMRTGWFISWEEIYDTASIVNNEGFYFRKTKWSGYSMNNWGVDPEEMRQAKALIRQKLPKSKTKRLR